MKNKKTKIPKPIGRVDSSVADYGDHPFFVKKAEEAKAYLKKVGLPEKFAKKIKL